MTSLACASASATAIDIDGQIGRDEWADAQPIGDFRMVQPFSRASARHATEAWLLSTSAGLAVAIRSTQPDEVPFTRQRLQRDASAAVDRVILYVDFDGDGRGGYSFSVSLSGSVADATISNENQSNADWDGDWRAATAEYDGGWSAEILIPWHVAPMQQAAGDTRKIGIAIERVVGASNERIAWPAIDIGETPFLSSLHKVEVAQHRQAQLAVAPYVVGIFDNRSRQYGLDSGADLFWKPGGQFQLSATLNPDFAQVESDELVVNFSAVETFFSDKRPFFTENQGLFDVPFGSADGVGRLLYTRRVGATADTGEGSADVAGALKLNSRLGGFGYGVFFADESGDAGRDFLAARIDRGGDLGGWGGMAMRVQRPFLHRVADVYAVDPRLRPRDDLNIAAAVVASRIEQDGEISRDLGGQLQVDHEIDDAWRQQLYLLNVGASLELNDFGFIERNDLNLARYELSRKITAMPDGSGWAWHRWRFVATTRHNEAGLRLDDSLAIGRYSERPDGRVHSWELSARSAGHDDLITRGNGIVRLPQAYSALYEYYRPRPGEGRIAFYGTASYRSEGLGGFGKGKYRIYLDPVYHVSDSVRVFLSLQAEHSNDALLWRENRAAGFQLATHGMDLLSLSAGLTWLFDDRQELRVRLEAIGLDAEVRHGWRLGADGRVVPSPIPIDNFALRRLGLQIRYRYELAPLSHLYVAYVRGGEMLDEGEGVLGVGRQLSDAFALRDSEQLLVKLSYRFAR